MGTKAKMDGRIAEEDGVRMFMKSVALVYLTDFINGKSAVRFPVTTEKSSGFSGFTIVVSRHVLAMLSGISWWKLSPRSSERVRSHVLRMSIVD